MTPDNAKQEPGTMSDERKDFEAAYVSAGNNEHDLSYLDDSGQYWILKPRQMWEGWQLRSALSAQPSPDAAETESTREQRNQPLEVRIESGVLHILIGVDLLCHAVQVPWKEQGINWKITDKDIFAQAIALELEREDEEGSTPVHFLLDKAADGALEQGADGAEEFEEDEDEYDEE